MPYQELLEQGGLYRDLYERQFIAWDKEALDTQPRER